MRPHQLSDAQRLRVALARAAVCLPEALVVDTPDPEITLPDLVARATLPATPQMAVLVITP
ncbi:hypothetical protein [Phytohabitans rumicis]|uniref:Uncharacterized protein n=1 Tax=Phytohabitans rumicis TaxID=1076125 RepID=A0A6V8LG61_9ACTN|nr:hypothetical protein [Phytohabitans rumicis]GFJ93076.1 hypothetical protein Prum_067180 [Phytohabitans rumicis]